MAETTHYAPAAVFEMMYSAMLVLEINLLGSTLHEQRLKGMEATALLDKLIGAIEVAIVAFDVRKTLPPRQSGCSPTPGHLSAAIRKPNRAGTWLGQPAR